MAACASVSRVATACSPYAVFRASDRVWARAWAPPPSLSLPSLSPPSLSSPAAAQPVVAAPQALPPARRRERRATAAVIQGELFGLLPGLPLPQPHARRCRPTTG